MPTVIDSLLIELGLDAAKFNQGQKKAVEDLRKFDEQSTKTNKAAIKGAKELDVGLGKIRNSLIAIGAAAMGVSGIKDFANQMILGNAALGRTSAMLGMSARDLDAWGKAAEVFGGDAKSLQGSLQGVEAAIAKASIGEGGDGLRTALAQLNVQAVDGKVNLVELADALKKVKTAYGPQTALALGEKVGMDQSSVQMLMEGGDAAQKLHDQFYNISQVTQKNTEDAAELNKQWVLMKANSEALSQTLIGKLSPAMLDIAKALNASLASPEAGEKQESFWQKVFGISNLGKNEDDELAKRWATVDVKAGNFSKIEKRYGLPSGMLSKVRAIESHGNDKAISPKGAKGPFQFMPSTATEFGLQGDDVFDLAKSADAAARKLSGLFKRYNGNIDKTLAAYNMGEGALDKSGMGGLPAETQGYLRQYRAMLGAGNAATSASSGNTSNVAIQTVNVTGGAVSSDGQVHGIDAALNRNSMISYSLTAYQ